jgi:transcriptional regulator with XRE-family HTH domain
MKKYINVKEHNLMKITGKSIGIRIKQVRGTDSQETAAKKTGVSISALRNYERDLRVPSLEIIDKIAKTYRISPALIAYGDESNLVDNEKLNLINRIMMFDNEEKKAITLIINALEIQSIIHKQDKR